MLGTHKLVVDRICDIFEQVKMYADDEFYVFANHTIIPGATYIIGRTQLSENVATIRNLIENNVIRVIFSNPFEGSAIMRNNCRRMGIEDLVISGKILVITGGDLGPEYHAMTYDYFMTRILESQRNRQEIVRYRELAQDSRPYKFLFLNGRSRPHRKYLIEHFRVTGLLEHSLWTCLDTVVAGSQTLKCMHQGQDLLLTPGKIQLLDPRYEYDGYEPGHTAESGYVKYDLFKNQWADIHLKAEPYLDTHFSLVTETVFEYPYSFRTEKTWKPIAIGHPFITVANPGHYRDLKNLGFKTFGHLIDESFDAIDNDQARMERTIKTVEDLCKQDLVAFTRACQDVCEHNQQHLAQLHPQVSADFIKNLHQVVNG